MSWFRRTPKSTELPEGWQIIADAVVRLTRSVETLGADMATVRTQLDEVKSKIETRPDAFPVSVGVVQRAPLDFRRELSPDDEAIRKARVQRAMNMVIYRPDEAQQVDDPGLINRSVRDVVDEFTAKTMSVLGAPGPLFGSEADPDVQERMARFRKDAAIASQDPALLMETFGWQETFAPSNEPLTPEAAEFNTLMDSVLEDAVASLASATVMGDDVPTGGDDPLVPWPRDLDQPVPAQETPPEPARNVPPLAPPTDGGPEAAEQPPAQTFRLNADGTVDHPFLVHRPAAVAEAPSGS